MKNHAPLTIQTHQLPKTDRLYYLDWLRVIAMLTVFFFHVSKLFDYHTTDIYNAIPSLGPSLFRELNGLWMMPLFFVISGASIHFSLKSRGPKLFLRERILRIGVPLIFIGTFVVNPPQIYMIKLFHGQVADGFFQWYPRLFEGMYPAGNFAPLGVGTHLWYLMSIFMFSLILLPLFLPGKLKGTSILSRISAWFVRPWSLFLFFIPIAAASAFFEAIGFGSIRLLGGWDQLSYLFFFIGGYIIFSSANIQETIRKYGPVFLTLALVLSYFYIDTHFGINLNLPGVTRHDLMNINAGMPENHAVWTAVQAFRGLLGWCWILGLLGLGMRFLNFKNRFLTYANEAVLPFYILHHAVIFIIGYCVIQLDSSIGMKFLITAVVSFAVIMALYEVLIRRVRFSRTLCGMKNKDESKRQQKALLIISGIVFAGILTILAVSPGSTAVSPPPDKPGLYVSEEYGFQLSFPEDLSKQGRLTSDDMLFHVRHPEEPLYLKIRAEDIPLDQPLDPETGKIWIRELMRSMGIKNPEVIAAEMYIAPEGTTVLNARVTFLDRSHQSDGMYTFFDRNGKRLFIAGYHDNGVEPLIDIMDSLAFE